MSNYFDSDALIASVKRSISIPENQSTYTADDLLAFANEEVSLSVVPAILSLHEDYLLFSQDVALETNKSDYVIPYRAIGNKLYDVQYVDSNGNVQEMSRTTESDRPYHNGSFVPNTQYSYSVKNNRVSLFSNMSGVVTGSLRFIYYIRPSQLVDTERVGIITAINTSTGVLTLSAMPEDFDTSVQYDFYKAKSPHNILSIDNDSVSLNTVTKTIEFDPEDLPDDLEIGDHVSLATECSIPQIPSDLHAFLAQKVAERVLASQRDLEALNEVRAKSKEMQDGAGVIIDNRVDESPIKLVNRNGPLVTALRNGFRNRNR